MENADELPFKVGDLAESKSFQHGYRGAWFRCKIAEIRKRKEHLEYALEYYDFPDEKLKWTKPYQVQIWVRQREKNKELMIRPYYPPIFNAKQVPDVSSIREATVVFDDAWKIGDLVDWWTTGCYWSGTIVQILSRDTGRIELYQPPYGEGLQYDMSFKDIRPSLDWSPKFGWEAADKRVNHGKNPRAWIIRPTVNNPVTAELAIVPYSSDSEKSKRPEAENENPQGDSSSTCMDGAKNEPTTFENSVVEAAVVDLQQCLDRVKLLKAILNKSRLPPSPAVTPRPRWKFLPPCYSSDDETEQ